MTPINHADPYQSWRPWRIVTVQEARALECNMCGDCCDSSRSGKTGTQWAWGTVPKSKYAEYMPDGTPLFMLLRHAKNGRWVERPWEPEDARDGSNANYRCRAFVPDPLDPAAPHPTGKCSLWDPDDTTTRPPTCSQFPVYSTVLDGLRPGDVYLLQTMVLTRCTWAFMMVVGLDPSTKPAIFEYRNPDYTLRWEDMPPDLVAATDDVLERVYSRNVPSRTRGPRLRLVSTSDTQ